MVCPRCQGTGTCHECNGTGAITCANCSGSGKTGDRGLPCKRCKGIGWEHCSLQCESCAGSGQITTELQKETADKYVMRGRPIDAGGALQVSYAIILLNILSFYAQQNVAGYERTFIFFGPAVDRGAWWQFITAQFLHGGLLHLGCNMYMLMQVGPQLEKIIGSFRFAAIYLISGAAGYALSYWMMPSVPTLGASGALYGIAATYIGLQWRYHLFLSSGINQLLVYLVSYLALGFMASQSLPLNNWAHLGGGLAGVALGYSIRLKR